MISIEEDNDRSKLKILDFVRTTDRVCCSPRIMQLEIFESTEQKHNIPSNSKKNKQLPPKNGKDKDRIFRASQLIRSIE